MRGLVERDGKLYVRKVYRDSAGKKKQIWRKVDSKSGGKHVLREIENELERGTESFENRDTLAEYLDKWLTTSRQNVCERTYEDYVGLLKQYVRPTLGTKKLANLRPLDVQELVNSMVARGLSPRTVRYTHSILQRALKRAVKWKMLVSNPASDVELPKSPKIVSERLGHASIVLTLDTYSASLAVDATRRNRQVGEDTQPKRLPLINSPLARLGWSVTGLSNSSVGPRKISAAMTRGFGLFPVKKPKRRQTDLSD